MCTRDPTHSHVFMASPRLAPRAHRFSILNISHMSELRGDVRTPSDCAQFCYPGPSFNWAEMLLRLLEQDHELNP